MTIWKEYKLGEIADFIDYRGKTPKKTTFGVPLITAKIVKNGTIKEPSEYISKEDYPKWMTRGFPKVGDVVLTTEAPLGEVAQIKDASYALAQRIITLRGKQNLIENGYLKYFLQSEKGQQRLKERETGTTVTGIKSSELKQVLISAPDLKTQTAIAEILSSLDDKIELNNKINQELENLAQTLFKQWFIDFEFPNQNGEPYKSSGGEIVDSELGEIPKGWEVGKYGEFTKTTSGGTPSRKKDEYYINGSILWVKSKELNNSMFFDTEEKINELALKNSSAKLLPPYSVLVAMYGATVGKFGLITTEAACNQAICAVLPSQKLPYSFNYLFFQNYRKELENFAVGSAQQNISQEFIKSVKIALPQNNLLETFHRLVEPFLNAIENNCRENKELTNLRDTLLPKLISGELEVKKT